MDWKLANRIKGEDYSSSAAAIAESVKLVIDTDKFYIFDNLKTESILVKKIREGINLHVIMDPMRRL